MQHHTLLSFALTSLIALPLIAAQDFQPTGGPPGGAIVALEAAGDRALAAAEGGLFVAEGAGPWSLVAPGATPAGATRGIAAATDAFYIWTSGAKLYRTDGAATEQVTSPGAASIMSLSDDSGDLYAIASDTRFSIGGDLLLSSDGAATWRPVHTPEEISAVHKSGDLLVATGLSAFAMYRSTDGGESWETLTLGEQFPFVFSAHDFTPAGDAMYAGAFSMTGAAAIIRSTDDGATWQHADTGLQARTVLDLHAEGEHIYAATIALDRTAVEVWRADASAAIWTRRAVAAPASYNTTAHLATHDGALLLAIGGEASLGMLRSTDGGATWTLATEGLSASSISAMHGGSEAALATSGAAGDLWRYDAAGGAWSTAAFPAAAGRIRAVAAMGADAWLAAGDVGGIRLSTDDGRSWRPANNGVPTYESLSGIKLREFNAFAASGSTWLAGGGPGSEWPPPGSKGAAAVETGGAAILRSTDGGQVWQRATAGFPVIGIAGDGSAHYPAILSLAATSEGFVAGTKAHGVFRSTDDGRTWSAGAGGLPTSGWTGGFASIVALAQFDAGPSSAIYAATDARDTDATVFRSTDGGATWTAVTGDLPKAPALDLQVHDGRLHVALGRIISGAGAGSGAGVWATEDGARWAPVGEALAARPASALGVVGDTLLAGTDGLGVWRFAPCAADLDGDGALTFFDFLMFQNLFAAGDLRADFDGDGALTFFDFLAFQSSFAAGCGD